MTYEGKVMRNALDNFERDKNRRKERFIEKQSSVYVEIPRIREIDTELHGTISKIIASALKRGTDPVPAIRVLKDENLSLQEEKRQLLVSYGYPEDYLEEKPHCRLCNDSGYRGDRMCSCLQEYYNREQINELSKMLDLGKQSFETFEFDWYSRETNEELGISPREQMESNYDACQDYAHQFGPRSDNLLLCGNPGLGKTFLSACIARVVSESGHSVVYDTAGHIFNQMEAVKFRRDDDEDSNSDVNRYMACDLLILDDLGTEMTTSFIQSALYHLINGRLLAGKKTIISTNLSPDEIGRRYSMQVLSRIEGEYQILPFFGTDIRRLKRQNNI